MKALKTKINKRGVQYALIQNGNTYGVYKLCENYSRHVKGGIAKTWRYIENNMTLEAAEQLFNRRAA